MTEPRSNADSVSPLEQAPWPVLQVDSRGVIRRANRAAVQYFGPEIEKGSAALKSLFPDANAAAAEALLAAMAQSTPVVHCLKLRSKEGLAAPFSARLCSWDQGREKVWLVQLLSESPAARPPREPSADTSLIHKQKLDCALQLARTVATDFNNALTTILGYTSLVLAKTGTENPWRQAMMEIEKAAERAAEIAHQLGSFTHSEKSQPERAPANLNAVLRRVVDLFRQPAKSKTDWTLELEERLYAARFDEAKVQQAFIKLVENALEACGQNGRIHIYSRNVEHAEPFQDGSVQLEAGCYVAVDITDDGPGIPNDVLPRVFEPFFTTKAGHRGLGLTWVYGVITNHRGGVTITSQPRQGTTVRVYLPADRRVVKERHAGPAEPRGHQTILMVDDEESLLGLGQAILSAYGYQVLTANSGPKALELLAAKHGGIDLVITDLVMPQMSGRELLEQIRALAPDLPVLCASGYVHPQSNHQENYLAKPFTAQELVWRVQQMLEDSK